jgi:hypothetical protein
MFLFSQAGFHPQKIKKRTLYVKIAIISRIDHLAGRTKAEIEK